MGSYTKVSPHRLLKKPCREYFCGYDFNILFAVLSQNEYDKKYSNKLSLRRTLTVHSI